MKIFDMPIETVPRWKFWAARVFGRKFKVDGFLFSKFRGQIWVLSYPTHKGEE